MRSSTPAMSYRTRIRRRRTDDPSSEELVERPAVAPADAVLALQQAHGNRAVRQMLARDDTVTETPKPAKDRFADAVKAEDWRAAAKALDELPDAEIQTLLKPLNGEQLDKLQSAAMSLPLTVPGFTDRVFRNVVFRLRPSPANIPKHPDQAKITDAGDEAGKAAVTGGQVSVHTDVEMELGSGRKVPQTFQLGYKGKDAGQTRWLQFISREIEVHPKTGKPTFIDATVGPPTGNQYKLTTDPTKRVWNTDAAKAAASPFYEDSGINNRTEDATTMFDAPSSAQALVNPQFAAPTEATKVISRAIFVTYLVRDMEIVEKVEISVTWEFVKPEEPPRSFHVAIRGPVAALDPAHRERLAAQFPAFNYLP